MAISDAAAKSPINKLIFPPPLKLRKATNNPNTPKANAAMAKMFGSRFWSNSFLLSFVFNDSSKIFLVTTSFHSLPIAMPTPVLFAMALPLHRTSANGNRNKRMATKNAAVAGIFVPNTPVDDGAGSEVTTGSCCGVVSMIMTCLICQKIRETTDKLQGNYQHQYLYILFLMNIQSICICGAGTMGSGIAQLSATAGFNTILYELNKDVLEKAKISIGKNLQNIVEKKKI